MKNKHFRNTLLIILTISMSTGCVQTSPELEVQAEPPRHEGDEIISGVVGGVTGGAIAIAGVNFLPSLGIGLLVTLVASELLHNERIKR